MILNKDLRLRIVDMVIKGKGGHIPSSFSIVDIINLIYSEFDVLEDKNGNQPKNNFTLSKGHGACALYSVLNKYGIISDSDIDNYLNFNAILGGHPDSTKVPGASASTGSLGHGLSFTLGRAMASKIKKNETKYFVLVGDGECHEGTIWESAIVANNLNLNNLICLVDYNQSSNQICPHNSLYEQFLSFGWETQIADGHDEIEIRNSLNNAIQSSSNKPKCIIYNTIKGKGVSFMEGHGPWHYKIPNSNEYELIIQDLKS